MSNRACEHADRECGPCFRGRMMSIQVGAGATPSRAVARKHIGARPTVKGEPSNKWEAGFATDSRGMPRLDSNGAPVGNKQYVESKRDYRDNEAITVK